MVLIFGFSLDLVRVWKEKDLARFLLMGVILWGLSKKQIVLSFSPKVHIFDYVLYSFVVRALLVFLGTIITRSTKIESNIAAVHPKNPGFEKF